MKQETYSAAPVTTSRQRARTATWASMVGAVADWYDYFLYGTAAAIVIGPLYFPGSIAGGTLAAFASFALGFFFRPVGSIVFGHFGDKLGRKRMLVLTMVLMAGASSLIGLLPTYADIGIAAPILLVILRAAQGFAVGGEWGGAALMAVESAPAGEKALRGSVVQSGAFLGLLLANGTFFLFARILSDDAFRAWGWRIPFLLSAVILAVGYWVRRKAQDTPEFEKVKREGKVVRIPLATAITKQPASFVIIIGLYLGANVATYTVLTFAIAYATVYAHVDKSVLLIASMTAAAVGLFTIPLCAKYADNKGYLRVFTFGAVLAIVMAFPFFWSLNSGNTLLIILSTVVVLAGAAVAMVSVQQPIFTELFSTEFRYSGAGFAYGLGAALGGLSPFIATYLTDFGGGTATYPALYMIGASAVTLLTALAVRTRIHGIYRRDAGPLPETAKPGQVKPVRP
jgi:MFS transporter, MHS family, shikimate and dehydroshikimate transport protein